MSDASAAGEYEDWDFEELRQAAFERARERHDVKFFINLFGHMPAAVQMADEGGSLGEIGGSISETVEAAKEMFGRKPIGDLEPMLRGVFATYLRESDA